VKASLILDKILLGEQFYYSLRPPPQKNDWSIGLHQATAVNKFKKSVFRDTKFNLLRKI
jgi:hypothetical protein